MIREYRMNKVIEQNKKQGWDIFQIDYVRSEYSNHETDAMITFMKVENMVAVGDA